MHPAIGLVAGPLGDIPHRSQQGPFLLAGLQRRAQGRLMLGIGLLQQVLLIASGAIVIAVDGALEQVEGFEPHLTLPAGFGGAFFEGVHVHPQSAIKAGNGAQQPLLQI